MDPVASAIIESIKNYDSKTLFNAERKEFKELAEESLLKLKQALGIIKMGLTIWV